MVRRGVVVNMMYFPHSSEDHAFMVFEIGPLPAHDPAVPKIMLALLDANFHVGDAHPPSLARNPASGDIVLRTVFTLAGTTPDAMLAAMDRGVDLAHEWRAGHFLEVERTPADPMAVAAGSLA